MNKLLLKLAIKIAPSLAISSIFIKYYCQAEKSVINIIEPSDKNKNSYRNMFLNIADRETRKTIKDLGFDINKYSKYVVETFVKLSANLSDYAEF